jgi:hypothetical protein
MVFLFKRPVKTLLRILTLRIDRKRRAQADSCVSPYDRLLTQLARDLIAKRNSQQDHADFASSKMILT